MKIGLQASKMGVALAALTLFVAQAWPATIGDPAPNFSLPALSGQATSLDEFKGKVVLLNFWASWCTPCQEELPELQKIYQKYRERGFEVLGVNIDKKQANAEKFVQRLGLSFPVVLDPESATIRAYRGRSMPISYLVDRQGTIRRLFFGFNRNKLPDMEAGIVEALDGTATH